jgi:L-lactate utilization protein LutC
MPGPDDRDGVLALFGERLADVQGTATVVPSREDAFAAVAALLHERGLSTIACAPSLKWPAVEDHWTDDPRVADFGLSEAEWGVAVSGTVVLRHRGERGRAYSLVPPSVGFQLPASRVIPRLGPVLAALVDDAGGCDGDAADLPACVTFVSGASHSSDIAGVSVVGVHGPADVHVWLIDDE